MCSQDTGIPVGRNRIGDLGFTLAIEPNVGNFGKGVKTLHVLEAELRDGIWYRVDAGCGYHGEARNEAVVSEEAVHTQYY
jgi:hypothetical protein